MIAAVVLAAAALAAPQASSRDTIHVVATYEYFTTTTTCEEMRHDPEWSFVPGGEFEIHDSAGRLLGAGHLDTGLQTPISCLFSTEFEANVAPDGIYQANIGGSEGDATTITEDHIFNGILPALLDGNDTNDDGVGDWEEGLEPVSEYQLAYRAWSDPSSDLYCDTFLKYGAADPDIAAVFTGDPAVMRQVLADHCTPLAPLFE